MRYLRFAALLGFCVFCASFASAQRVVVGVGVGPAYVGTAYVGPPPVCAYGYYDYYPYACAPYGYYGPDWFVNGVFIGVGPWYHSYWRHPGWYGRGFYGRGYYGRGFYGRGWDHDGWRGREFHGDRGFHGERGFRDGHEFRGDRGFRGDSGFHGDRGGFHGDGRGYGGHR
ncbi:MAG TPA: hypothetical protein VJN92_07900 [Candidatus Acidoferrum sp.]|nr:hypothetical protein [Candidatus Acidoferrum sp.]